MKPLLTMAIALVSLALSAQERSPTQQGIAAFNDGNYQQALDYFQRAKAQGNDALSVDYNIAVSLYRLGRYREAEQYFHRLGGLPDWEVLLNYNLGLVLEAQGRHDEARRYFELAAAQDEQEKIRDLANNRLSALGRPTTVTDNLEVSSTSAKPWAAQVKITGGMDSNASSLADALLEQPDSGKDSFFQLLLYSHVYAQGRQQDGLRLYGVGFAKRFEEFDFLDSQVLGAGVAWEKPWRGWQSELGLNVMATGLDNREVADQWQLRGSLWKRFHPGTFKFTLSYSNIDAGRDFQQIDGDRYRLEAMWAKRFNALTTELRYRHEWNNRRDLSRGGGFASHSPIRSSIRGKLHWRLQSGWRAYMETDFIDSHYRDSNLLRDIDGQVKQARRENHKLRLTAGVSYRIGQSWLAELEYRYEESDDNFILYTYDKNQVHISLQRQL